MKVQQGGFAMLALMFVVGAASFGLIVIAATFPTFGETQRRAAAEERTRAIALAAEAAFRLHDTLPTDLDTIDAAGVLSGSRSDDEVAARIDPLGEGADLVFRIVSSNPATLSATSRGNDRRLGTSDDITFSRSTDWVQTGRSRRRLQILRAHFLTSRYMVADTMGPADRRAMRDLVAEWSRAQRAIRHAGSEAERNDWIARRDAAEVGIGTLRGLHLLTETVPSNATGSGGLLEELSLPDDVGTDGFERTVEAHPAVGFTSLGPDGIGGTDDDL